jgi:hypothetical protein
MTETTPYEVTGTAGEAELRHYPTLVLATVPDDGDDRGFRLLFAYITGGNRARTTIPMTAPVITSEMIPMTAPVISGPGTMSFVMPAGMGPDRAPEPTDDRVRIETVPARDVAVVRFSGHARRHDVEAVTARLLGELAKAGIAVRGAPFLMRYNAPMTPGFLRRNEVGVEIQR